MRMQGKFIYVLGITCTNIMHKMNKDQTNVIVCICINNALLLMIFYRSLGACITMNLGFVSVRPR